MGSDRDPSGTFQYYPFKDLGKIMEKKIAEGNRVKSGQKSEDVSDNEIFQNAMKEVAEIKEFSSIQVRRKRAAPMRKKESAGNEERLALQEIVSGKRPLNLCDTQEYIEWTNRDYAGEIVMKLREGKFSVQDCLDLHGLSLAEAEKEVDNFLKNALRKKSRCIRIIHGRGLRSPRGPVIKQALIKWLTFRHRKHIIAFSTARQCDGGLGAIYILLR